MRIITNDQIPNSKLFDYWCLGIGVYLVIGAWVLVILIPGG